MNIDKSFIDSAKSEVCRLVSLKDIINNKSDLEKLNLLLSILGNIKMLDVYKYQSDFMSNTENMMENIDLSGVDFSKIDMNELLGSFIRK